MATPGAFLGRLACGLGAAAILLLGVDLVLGPAGFALLSDPLRLAIPMPMAGVGVLAGLLMLRRRSSDRTTRQFLLAGAIVPLVPAALIFGIAPGLSVVPAYEILVGTMIVCWALYAALIVLAGLRLRRAGEGGAAGLLLCGAGAGLLLQSAGGAGALIFGPDRLWPDLLIQYGIAVAATFLALLLIIVAIARSRNSR